MKDFEEKLSEAAEKTYKGEFDHKTLRQNEFVRGAHFAKEYLTKERMSGAAILLAQAEERIKELEEALDDIAEVAMAKGGGFDESTALNWIMAEANKALKGGEECSKE